MTHARPLPLLAVFLVAVSIAGAAVARTIDAGVRPELLADAFTLDLLVSVPLAYWILAVRGAGWPRISVLPVVVLASAAAPLVPGLDRGTLLHAVRWVAVPAELLLLTLIARRAIAAGRDLRRGRGRDALEDLRGAALKLVEVERAADVIAYEVAVLWYAFGRPASRHPQSGDTFRNGGRSGYAAIFTGLLPVLVAETLAVHFFVRHWSPVAAWLLTALSAYAALWLVGDFRALGRRLVVVTDEALHVRVGLRWTARIALAEIRAVREAGDPAAEDHRPERHLKAVVLGPERQIIELHRPVVAVGLYGIRRRVWSIGLAVEETEQFLEAVRRRVAALEA